MNKTQNFLLISLFLTSFYSYGQNQSNELTGFGGQYVGNIATSRYVRKTKLFLYPEANGSISGLVTKKITSGPILIKFEGSYKMTNGSIIVDVKKSYEVNKAGERTRSVSSSLAIMNFEISNSIGVDAYQFSNKARWQINTRPREYVKYELIKKLEPNTLFSALIRQDADDLTKEMNNMQKKGLSIQYFINAERLSLLEQAIRMGSLEMTKILLDNGISTSAQKIEILKGNIASSQDLMKHVGKVQKANVVYVELMSTINQSNYFPNWQELLQLEKRANSEFAILLPNQINRLKVEIEKFRPESAYEELKRLKKVQLTTLVGKEKISKISNFTDHNYQLYNQLNDKHRIQLKEQLNELLEHSLAEQMKLESNKVLELPVQMSSMETLNSNSRVFKQEYRNYMYYTPVKDVNQLFKLTKSKFVVQLADQISSKIKSSQNLKSLEEIKKSYLTEIGSHSAISQLKVEHRNRKKEIEQHNEQIALEQKREAAYQLKLKIKKIYGKVLKNSNRLISSSEMEQIINRLNRGNKDGLTYFSQEEMDVKFLMANYLKNITRNKFYIFDKMRSESLEILNQRKSQSMTVFQTRQEVDCYFNPSNGVFNYNRKMEVSKMVNSSAWRIAQRCPSVKALLEKSTEYEFQLIGVTVDEETGIPIMWHTRIIQEVCGQRAVYDNCRTPCHTYLRNGSENFYLYLTEALKRFNQ